VPKRFETWTCYVCLKIMHVFHVSFGIILVDATKHFSFLCLCICMHDVVKENDMLLTYLVSLYVQRQVQDRHQRLGILSVSPYLCRCCRECVVVVVWS
jgi:hypothetical protein